MIAATLGPGPAGAQEAARPFVTDDARSTDKGACQLETWGQLGPDDDQFWFLPDHVQFDTTYGSQLESGNNDWVTMGLRFISPPFL